MSRNTPYDKIKEHLFNLVEAEVDSAMDHCGKSTESPIEKILATAIVVSVNIGQYGFFKLLYSPEHSIETYGTVRVEFQKQIGNYRADIVFTMWNAKKNVELVVECDGHDFHERTKEQAARDRARDRSMTLEGKTVLRFTGSEIYNNPMGCAEQVVSWCYGQIYEREKNEGMHGGQI